MGIVKFGWKAGVYIILKEQRGIEMIEIGRKKIIIMEAGEMCDYIYRIREVRRERTKR